MATFADPPTPEEERRMKAQWDMELERAKLMKQIHEAEERRKSQQPQPQTKEPQKS